MKLDLSFFLEPPEMTQQATLEITALAPLSMVSSQPGTYFRSEVTPTNHMILGLIENALGWHFEDSLRRDLFKSLQKKAQKKHRKNPDYAQSAWLQAKPESSGSGYFSLLQFHLKMEPLAVDQHPMAYDDLWSMQLRTMGDSFIGGSRNYDGRLDDLITLSRKKVASEKGDKPTPSVVFGDKKDFATFTLEELLQLVEGKVKTTSLKPFFPHYYSSPKNRGYVVPNSAYQFSISCTAEVSKLIKTALDQPSAPLYLGSNDGWVELKWKDHE